MKHRLLSAFCLFGCLALSAVAAAEVRVQARVDRTLVQPGEALQLGVTLEGAEGSVQLDALTDFKVVFQGTSTAVQFVDNRTTRQVTYNYLLFPQKQGDLTIPALEVKVNGRVYATEPIAVSVAPASTGATAEAAPEVWVSAEVSHPEPFVGQQLIYTFSLFNRVQVSDARFQPPDFEGFEARELEKRDTHRKIINGREHVVTQVDYILIPRRSATLTINPAGLRIGVVRTDIRRRSPPGFDSIFNDPLFNRGTVEQRFFQTEPLLVRVRPLPAYQGPGPFSGLVGRFELAVDMEKTDLSVGDSATLTLTLTGTGNIMDATVPLLHIPSSFKTYADTPQEEISITPQGYTGKKIFRIAVVPVEPGRFSFPAADWTYFDPAAQTYVTLSPAPITLTVLPAAATRAAAPTVMPTAEPPRQQTVAFTGRDILPLKEDLDAVTSRRTISPTAFILWLFCPLLAYSGLLAFQRIRNQDQRPADRMRTRARGALRRAARAGGDRDILLGSLYQALGAAILAAAGRCGETLTWKEAEMLLTASGHDESTARQASELLARIESGKFSGADLSAEQLAALNHATRRMVRKLVP